MVGSFTPTHRHAEGKGRYLALSAALLLSALGMAFAIASPQHWWLGWTALLPMFHAIRVLSPRRAAISGALWGGALFAFCVSLFDTPVPTTLGAGATLVAAPALYAFLGARLTAQIGFSPYLLALGWMGVEFALAPVGLRHGLLASTQDGGVLLSAFGSFTGYVLIAFVVAYINAALLSALHQVGAAARSARVFVRTGDDPKPIVVDEAFQELLLQVCRARPRAPPAC